MSLRSKTPRKSKMLPLGDISDSLIGALPQLSEEEWRKRDELLQAEKQRERAREEAKATVKRQEQMLEARFPKRAMLELDGLDKTMPAIQRVEGWDPTRENILVLSGANGCGKTAAAVYWASRHRTIPRYVRAATFAASSRYDRSVKEAWLYADALVLDDLGAEWADASGSFLVDLDELLDVYYSDMKPLLITTNCNMETLKERLGGRIVDRLRECGSFYSVPGGSLRGK